MTGPEYSEAEQRKFFDSGAAYLPRTRVLSLSEDRTAAVTGPEGLRLIGFRECVIAAGCMERPIGALNVAGTRPRGVYTAGEAQELINIDHRDIGSRIFILGSGDIGMIMARRFSLLGKEVVRMAEIRGVLGGMARNRRECVEAFGIPVSLNSTVTEIHGWPDITGVTLRHLDDGTEELVGCDALITSIGLIPDRSLADPLLTDDGYPVWLHFCGNADEVHEIADSVSSEGDRLGAEIAERLNPAKQN